MKTFFSSQDLWEIAGERFTNSEKTSTLGASQEKELKENKHKYSKALFILQQEVADNILQRITGNTNANDGGTVGLL